MIRTFDAPKQVTRFRYDLSRLWRDEREMVDYFMDVQRTLRRSNAITRDMGLTVRLTSNSYTIAGYYYGSRNQFRALVQPVLDKAMPKIKAELEQLSWTEALARIAGVLPLAQGRNSRVGQNFYAKSLLTGYGGIMSGNGLEDYFYYLIQKGYKWPGRWVVTFRLMGGRDSKVTEPYEEKNSAISFRDSMWIIQHDGNTAKDPRDVSRFIQGAHDKLKAAQPRDSFQGSFSPFLDPTLSNSQAHKAYFTSTKYLRLSILKERWDKDEIFWNPHSVKPT